CAARERPRIAALWSIFAPPFTAVVGGMATLLWWALLGALIGRVDFARLPIPNFAILAVWQGPGILLWGWSMRRALERNIPGLIWRISWKDTGLAFWGFVWRSWIPLLPVLLALETIRNSVALPPYVLAIPPWLIFVWAMRGALRAQFKRSLRQGRIQGATGILGESDAPQ
ncbi:MAG: hypothetical protein O2968_02075, partial [Acidobacteria bacterium]|nr:hypothetical protein [Acidobacteriota bacterium]